MKDLISGKSHFRRNQQDIAKELEDVACGLTDPTGALNPVPDHRATGDAGASAKIYLFADENFFAVLENVP